MTVHDVAKQLNLTCCVDADGQRTVEGGYVGDLLSWVIGKAGAGHAWITIMSNPNVAAVAMLADTSMIILAESVEPDDTLLAKAQQHGLNLYMASEGAFELAWRLHELLG